MPMRIVKLTIRHFKRISAAEINPDGSLVTVRGKNGAGKSSVLDAIIAALGGKNMVPQKAVRDGERSGEVVVDLGEYIVRRKFAARGNTTSLEVLTRDGQEVKSPQAFLKSLVGPLAFDPVAFRSMAPAKQAEQLRNLAGLDFTELDTEREIAYNRRADLNRDVKSAQSRLGAIHPPADKQSREPVSLTDLLAKRDLVSVGNRSRVDAESVVHNIGVAVMARREQVEVLEQQLADAKAAVDERQESFNDASKQLEAIPVVADMEPFDSAIASAESDNARARDALEYDNLKAEIGEHEAHAESQTVIIEGVDSRKRRMIDTADLPVPGLGFSAEFDGITIDALPFDQASQSEQLATGVAIVLAGNPELRIVLIHAGNDLDSESLAALRDTAEKYDAQVWLERVADEDDGSGLGVFIEDGHIAAA